MKLLVKPKEDINIYKANLPMMQQIHKVKLMGIINATPDSFSGDGISTTDSILKQAENFIKAGADILDIGGESTRPNAEIVSAQEELRRVIPAIEAIRQQFPKITISIDTYKAEVAYEAVQAGANMINDVEALQGSAGMAEVVAKAGVPVVLMHNRARRGQVTADERIGDSYDGSDYKDVVADVSSALQRLASQAESQGIEKDNIILDAGIGFGKTIQQNLQLIMATDKLKALGYPILLGASRKSFIGKLLDREVEDRLAGSVACVAMAVIKGADIIRVHDVQFTSDFIKMFSALQEAGHG